MSRRNENILDLLSHCPWWISVGVAVAVYLALRFVVPSIAGESLFLKSIASVAPNIAWLVAIVFLLPAAVSAVDSLRKRRLLDRQSGIDSIRALSWKEFEELLAEAYRRDGYAVRENVSTGPDGGVDLRIEKDGNVYLVQCKQWRIDKVGVSVVREMYGLMTAERASGVIVATSGMFTQEAKNFAAHKPIDLVEGNQLVHLIRNVSIDRAAVPRLNVPPAPTRCPRCGNQLVIREAKRGEHVGGKFWGCASFPSCRHTQPYEA